MSDFNLDGLVFVIFILFLIGLGLYILVKNAVKAALREIEEKKAQELIVIFRKF